MTIILLVINSIIIRIHTHDSHETNQMFLTRHPPNIEINEFTVLFIFISKSHNFLADSILIFVTHQWVIIHVLRYANIHDLKTDKHFHAQITLKNEMAFIVEMELYDLYAVCCMQYAHTVHNLWLIFRFKLLNPKIKSNFQQ